MAPARRVAIVAGDERADPVGRLQRDRAEFIRLPVLGSDLVPPVVASWVVSGSSARSDLLADGVALAQEDLVDPEVGLHVRCPGPDLTARDRDPHWRQTGSAGSGWLSGV